ncbi:TolC family protein [Candidatus Methylospira mobilis]|uniref:TolC family protein n=1 Tax=Candidatus Methylospira mobilis TaxID=1808979 RepID=A0A5Q0BLL1_9GAMM|nr:TolC family protein [Candidatus Methylospira mobilis]
MISPRNPSRIRKLQPVSRRCAGLANLIKALGFTAIIFLCPAHGAEIDNPPPFTITEQQALKLFFERNIDLILAHYDIESGVAQQIIAAALPNPSAQADFNEINSMIWTKQISPNSRVSWAQGSFPSWGLRIEQMIITAGKRTLRIEGSELGTQGLEYDLRNTVRTLSNAVRHAYYALLLAQKSAELAQSNLERYRKIVNANKIRLDVGDIAGYDYTRIEVESLQAESDVDTTEAEFKRAQAELLLLMGWPEHAIDIQATGQWPESAGDGIGLKPQNELIKQALDKRPDLAASKIRVAQAEKNRELAKRMVIPDITLIGYYLKDPGNFYVSSGGVGFKLDLPLFYRQEGEIAASMTELNKARVFIQQSEQNIHADVINAQASWKSAEAITHSFEQSVLQRIEARRKAVEFAYRKGATGFLELLDAVRTYKEMMQEYYNALGDRSNAWADLIMATGQEVH